MQPYNSLLHPRGWRAFMEYGNGIVGDMCVHMLEMVRRTMDLGWPTRVSSNSILVDKASKANISGPQTAMFDYPKVKVIRTHRSWGRAATFYGDKETFIAGLMGLRHPPRGCPSEPNANPSQTVLARILAHGRHRDPLP